MRQNWGKTSSSAVWVKWIAERNPLHSDGFAIYLQIWYIFRRNTRTYESWGSTKECFCSSQVVLAWGLFEGFFGLKKASKGQKTPKNSSKAKTNLAKAKQVFVLVLQNDEKCRASREGEKACVTHKKAFFWVKQAFSPSESEIPCSENSYWRKKFFVLLSKENKSVSGTKSDRIKKTIVKKGM